MDFGRRNYTQTREGLIRQLILDFVGEVVRSVDQQVARKGAVLSQGDGPRLVSC